MLLRPRAPKTAIAASALLLLAGCSLFEPSETPERERGEAFEVGLFEEGKVPLFELSVKEKDWRWLNENALKELYVPAKLAIDGVEIGKVGVRYKGSSTLRNCFAGDGPRCPRASLKIKFDEYLGLTRVDGMERINLEWSQDLSLLRERLAHRIFREAGVEAARVAHARLSVNGGSAGVYVMAEAVDGPFAASRWSSADVIWKEAWPRESYSGWGKRLVHGDAGAETGMTEFAKALREAAETGDRELFERYVDPVQTLNYLAVDVAVGNFDGFRTFYCPLKDTTVLDDCFPHNFYWRQTWPENRFTLVPWDLDGVFAVPDWASKIPEWNDTTVSCDERLPIKGHRVWFAGCDPFFRVLRDLYPDEWKQALRALARGPMMAYYAERWLKEWRAEIASFVAEDTLFNTVYDVKTWDSEWGGLTQAIAAQRELLQKRLEGKLP